MYPLWYANTHHGVTGVKVLGVVRNRKNSKNENLNNWKSQKWNISGLRNEQNCNLNLWRYLIIAETPLEINRSIGSLDLNFYIIIWIEKEIAYYFMIAETLEVNGNKGPLNF